MITQTFIFLTLVFPCYWFWSHSISNPYFEMQVMHRLATYHRYHSKISDPSYELVCENNKTVLYVNYGRQLVEAFYATNSTTLQSITAGVDINNCSAITHHSLTYNNFTQVLSSAEETELVKENELHSKNYRYSEGGLLFVSCKNPLSSDLYKDIVAPCASEAPESLYSYVLTRYSIVSDVAESCKIEMMVKMVPWGPMTCNEKCSHPQVQSQEVKGIDIKWRADRCGVWEGGEPSCWFENATNMVLCPYEVAINPISEMLLGELHG